MVANIFTSVCSVTSVAKNIFFIVFLLSACATQQKTFIPERPSAEKGSIVYIYRPNSFSNVVVSPDVLINGEKKFPLSNDRYTFIYLEPGRYTFALDLAEHYQGNHSTVLNILPEHVHYLKITSALKFEQGKAYTRRFDITLPNESSALAELADCRYIEPRMPSKYLFDKKSADDEEAGQDDAQFSIDKTSDPFSRNKQ